MSGTWIVYYTTIKIIIKHAVRVRELSRIRYFSKIPLQTAEIILLYFYQLPTEININGSTFIFKLPTIHPGTLFHK